MLHKFSAMSIIISLVSVWTLLAVTSANLYNLGLCRPYITKRTFKQPVTLHQLSLDGEFTVLYTSGLKQLQEVSCATFQYTYNTADTYTYRSYVKADGKEEVLACEAHELAPGAFLVTPKDNEYSTQFVKYHSEDILLIYWCKDDSDDNYYNNIWMIAAKTALANTKKVKKEILDMLYHDDYKGFIDRDLEDLRNERKKYVELTTCN
ncbi:uncharacterized protein LOC128985821 [Macrosteles quadrilineatus]|uniref:uncharacterized protein LOC128985821 n=1 Tax=Macrosteles quadrilineatus TaxID=74068 RepID=UPI0023E1E19A|nr:uncharacterized protein LOC128985821 [Macrosteles quadrilineatus]XP_054261711.1 uncharacterized protein LOC128985821 [Macrosteles quadrilineatus]